MKTAEEWVRTCPSNALEFVKQIQLDAYKAGMSEAAEIVDNNKLAKVFTTGDMIHNYICRTNKESIFTARDEMETI